VIAVDGEERVAEGTSVDSLTTTIRPVDNDLGGLQAWPDKRRVSASVAIEIAVRDERHRESEERNHSNIPTPTSNAANRLMTIIANIVSSAARQPAPQPLRP